MDKSRQQFEVWFKKEYEETMIYHDDNLIKFVGDQLFIVWQASRESLEVELSKDRSEVSCYESGLNNAVNKIDDTLNRIKGVKVK